ncbi:4'-phosphopantetheinyl transferase family protein [Bacillus thuringiensis]|uniref:4-phosphopantetheinyl transferase n=1 Tax=Bacillus thuringiensis TaxID=1428 RepID=A0A9X7BLP6_BACTU|nr:4'-phosphopantetheinyl transferase superfamily protein [Bacillus thuringiensis]MED4445711.1 4'-phosphopantetheinyl transferase superfamily protein [Bacillus cereus]PEB44119.1 4-phosphopantetheinyl transferase [Bacillus thuringiensis]PED24999.1 4-phosphopantetheinyl transferase [Bacillus thuringiensis]PFL11132.1 4-phosphopantetheinyl transferase [Bacillus thuringiensis]PFV27994.1 4-phosphopantetheinyl transferase [Bacillus thuringiensis]
MKLYAVDILDIGKEIFDNACSLIDLDKRCKIEKFINKKDKIRTLIGEILIRTIICEDLRIRNKNIKFEKNKYGKPYLIGYNNFQFNISHSGNFLVCAVDDKPIGIDIEKVKYIEYKDIAKRFFSVSEFDYIDKEEDLPTQLNKFYEIWTLKESYIKCCGQGLSIPLKSFSIDIDKYENIKVKIPNQYTEHVFRRFDIDSGYKISVCSVNKEIPNNIKMIDQNSLIDYFRLEL